MEGVGKRRCSAECDAQATRGIGTPAHALKRATLMYQKALRVGLKRKTPNEKRSLRH